MQGKSQAIIYCRVSTTEQALRGYSLEAQEKDCRKFAAESEYAVAKVFIDRGESAKTTDRPELQKLIKFAVENKKNIACLIIWKYDRLARNLSDQMELVKNFSAIHIRVLSVTETNEDSSVGKLMRNIIGSFAQYENDLKSERTKKGMLEAIRQGRWCWVAPLGYKFSRDEFNKPLLIPTDDSKYVKTAFEMLETGEYRQTDIVHRLRADGMKQMTLTLINKILRNCLYAGLIKNSWIDEYVDGLHVPIISKDTYFKVQHLLDGKRPYKVKRRRNRPDFPLKGLLFCPTCGRKLTAGWSTGRLKTKYGYYHCANSACSVNLRKELVEDAFYSHLQTLQPPKEYLDLFERIVIDTWQDQQENQTQEKTRIAREIGLLEVKKARIDELMIKGTFDDETYKQRTAEIRGELIVKTVELNETKIDSADIGAQLDFAKYFVANIAELWRGAELSLKQQFQSFIFPIGITYADGAIGTKETALIFSHFQVKNKAEYLVASPTGFEPVSSP